MKNIGKNCNKKNNRKQSYDSGNGKIFKISSFYKYIRQEKTCDNKETLYKNPAIATIKINGARFVNYIKSMKHQYQNYTNNPE